MPNLSDSQKSNFLTRLRQGSEELGFVLSAEQSEALIAYLGLLLKWNTSYNLTAIRDPEEMLSKHLLDSMSIVALLAKHKGQYYLDVGTGAGLPGIPLAICLPEKHFTLIDSAGKKIRFLFQVKQALKLENLQLENARVESYSPPHTFDAITTRAYSSLKKMTEQCRHLIKDNGEFWAMKGVFPQDELSEVQKNYIVDHLHTLSIPELEGDRCIVVLKPKSK